MAISFVNVGAQTASNSSPQTPTLPASTKAGDLLLVICLQSSAAAVTFNPSGYTSIARNSDATRAMTLEVFAKTAVDGDSAPSTTCSAATAGWCVQMAAYRGTNHTVTLCEDTPEVGSSAPAAATFQPTGITLNGRAMVLSVVGTKDDNALNFNTANGYTLRMSGASYDDTAGNGSDYSVGLAEQSFSTSGAKTCPTWNQSVNGNDAWIALTLALKPDTLDTVTPTTLAHTTTKYAPVLQTAVTPSTHAMTTTKFAPRIGLGVVPATVNLTTSTFAPTLIRPILCTPGVMSLITSTFSPTIVQGLTVTPTTLSLITTYFAPEIKTRRKRAKFRLGTFY